MNLEMEIRAAIGEICIEKNNRHIVPVHATFLEIMERVKAPRNEVEECINQMIVNKRLEWGPTAHGSYFRNIPKTVKSHT